MDENKIIIKGKTIKLPGKEKIKELQKAMKTRRIKAMKTRRIKAIIKAKK